MNCSPSGPEIACPISAICFRGFYVGGKAKKGELIPHFYELCPHPGAGSRKTGPLSGNSPSESPAHESSALPWPDHGYRNPGVSLMSDRIKHPYRPPPPSRSLIGRSIARCNIAKCDLTNSRRKTANCSGRIPVFLGIMTSPGRGAEGNEVQRGLKRALIYQGRKLSLNQAPAGG